MQTATQNIRDAHTYLECMRSKAGLKLKQVFPFEGETQNVQGKNYEREKAR